MHNRNSPERPGAPTLRPQLHRGDAICYSGYREGQDPNRNIPGMLGNILSILAGAGINIVDMLNRSRDNIAYNLIDVDGAPSEQVLAQLCTVEGVVNVRLIAPPRC